MKRSILESIVGFLVLAVVVVSIVFAVRSSDVRQGGGYEIVAAFGNAAGLSTGTDVRLAGVKVGSVSEQRIDPETFEAQVVLTIDQSVPLPVDSTIRIVPDGLLGGTYILLQPGASEQMAEPGARFEDTGDAINVVELVTRIVTLAVDARSAGEEEAPADPGDSGFGLDLGLD